MHPDADGNAVRLYDGQHLYAHAHGHAVSGSPLHPDGNALQRRNEHVQSDSNGDALCRWRKHLHADANTNMYLDGSSDCPPTGASVLQAAASHRCAG